MAFDTVVLDGEMNVSVVYQTGDRLQDKTANPTLEEQVIRADSGFYGLSTVTINPMTEGSATTPDTAITANPSISVGSDGTITATVSESESITPTVEEGYIAEGTAGTVTVSGNASTQLDTQGAAAITPTESAQTAVAPGKFTTGAVTVKAIPSDYVGSTVPQRDSADVTASGATVTVPSGYYDTAASKTVQNGTEGTPIATKGAVSNHSVSVTPSVTNAEGYINGGTKTGTPVTVSASELVSGSQTVNENGVVDVTNLASLTVNVGEPEMGEKTVTANGVYTASADNLDGYSKVTVTVPASAVDSGTKNISTNGTHDVVGYAAASVAVPASEVDSGTKAITQNGAGQDVVGYAAVDVDVPNSYTQADEGKVVSSGALVSQSSATYTFNTTYDTTLINSVTVDVPSSGGGISTDDIAQKTISVAYGSSATFVGSYAFYYNSSLTVASFPVATVLSSNAFDGCASLSVASFPLARTLNNYVFRGCSKLQTVNFPSVKTIGTAAFASCASLTTVSFPEATSIGQSAFSPCPRLASASFPKVTSIGNSAFLTCSSLGTADFPEATYIGINAFAQCSNLSTVSFPVVISVGDSAFLRCSKLTEINLPSATRIGVSAFLSCAELVMASLPKISQVSGGMFTSCYHLISLYLLGSSVPGLANSAVFTSTPIAGYSTSAGQYGSIYVPASLFESFKTANNWSYFSSRMVSV